VGLPCRIFPENTRAIEGKRFFFEKKNQKTFTLTRAAGDNRDSDANVFCFFSSEKKCFLVLNLSASQELLPGVLLNPSLPMGRPPEYRSV
jgi:hypothetical protein